MLSWSTKAIGIEYNGKIIVVNLEILTEMFSVMYQYNIISNINAELKAKVNAYFHSLCFGDFRDPVVDPFKDFIENKYLNCPKFTFIPFCESGICYTQSDT